MFRYDLHSMEWNDAIQWIHTYQESRPTYHHRNSSSQILQSVPNTCFAELWVFFFKHFFLRVSDRDLLGHGPSRRTWPSGMSPAMMQSVTRVSCWVRSIRFPTTWNWQHEVWHSVAKPYVSQALLFWARLWRLTLFIYMFLSYVPKLIDRRPGLPDLNGTKNPATFHLRGTSPSPAELFSYENGTQRPVCEKLVRRTNLLWHIFIDMGSYVAISSMPETTGHMMPLCMRPLCLLIFITAVSVTVHFGEGWIDVATCKDSSMFIRVASASSIFCVFLRKWSTHRRWPQTDICIYIYMHIEHNSSWPNNLLCLLVVRYSLLVQT